MSLSEFTVPRRRSRRRREDSKLADHVERLGEEHPPIPLESVDYTIKRIIEVVTKLREMSPLYEMAKEGIDLKSVQWAAH